MNRSGCKNCPVKPCETLYRGSICLSRRHKLGLGDTMTNADRIRAMSDDELAKWLYHFLWDKDYIFLRSIEEFLKQPAEEDDHDERKENENV